MMYRSYATREYLFHILLTALYIVLSAAQRTTPDPSKPRKDGTVALLAPTLQHAKFNSKQFSRAVAHQCSIWCKLAQDHCDGDDKHIRVGDVRLLGLEQRSRGLVIHCWVRDPHKRFKAALNKHQLANVFYQYKSELQRTLGYPQPMQVLSPARQIMEPWRIAVIVVCSVVGAAMLVALVVLVVRRKKMQEKKEEQEHRLSVYNNIPANQSASSFGPQQYETPKVPDKELQVADTSSSGVTITPYPPVQYQPPVTTVSTFMQGNDLRDHRRDWMLSPQTTESTSL